MGRGPHPWWSSPKAIVEESSPPPPPPAALEALVARAKVLPLAYAAWWRRLLRESPEHVLVETLLILFLVFVVWAGRRQRAKQESVVRLSKKEVDELVAEWEPEPLVPERPLVAEIAKRKKVVESWTETTISFDGGRPLLNCGTLAFLAGAGGDAGKEAAKRALEKYGCGSCGPRGFYGSIDVHEELEAKMASFFGAERAIAFSDAASCATSTIAAFAKRGDLLVVDEKISEPLRTGCVLSRANVTAFAHHDVADLARVLAAVAEDDQKKKRPEGTQRRFVVVEAVGRTDCDVAPLEPMLTLCHDYGYRLILDEGLSFGVLGTHGRGLSEHLADNAKEAAKEAAAAGKEADEDKAERALESKRAALEKKTKPPPVDITIVDLGPALGSVGGLCLGNDDVIEHQRLSGAGYCFSAAAPPFVSAVALAALETKLDPGVLETLRRNAKVLRDSLRSTGLVPAFFRARTLANPRDDVVPVVHLALAHHQKSGDDHRDVHVDLNTLDAIANAMAHAGFAVAVVKHGLEREFKLPSKLLPTLPHAPLALKVATNASHEPHELLALCTALKLATKPYLAS